MIMENYSINENTLALLPAKQIDFDTIVIEKDRKIKVRKTSLELIKAACYNEWSTYEGRRQAVIHHTNFKRKVPIPINIRNGNYFFPTHSPTSIYNKWFSYLHIDEINKHPSNPTKTIITFYNGIELCVNIPYHLLDKQMQRTFECMYRMKRFWMNNNRNEYDGGKDLTS